MTLITCSMFACGGEQETVAHPAPLAALPEKAAVQGAASTTSTEGVTLTMQAHVWHDDMPGPGKPVPGLMVVTTLRSSATTMPAGVRLERVYVVRGAEVWASPYADERRPAPANAVEGVARNGPLWRGPETVDVVAQIRVGSGETAYLAHRHVEITSSQ